MRISIEKLATTIMKLAHMSKEADKIVKSAREWESKTLNNEVEIEELDKQMREARRIGKSLMTTSTLVFKFFNFVERYVYIGRHGHTYMCLAISSPLYTPSYPSYQIGTVLDHATLGSTVVGALLISLKNF